MKRMTIFLAALGFASAAVAQSPDLSALPEGESAYGYSLSDPYTDGTISASRVSR